VDFLLPGPAFDLGLAFESGGFIRLLFGIDYFDGFVGAGIGSAPAFLVIKKSFLGIGRNAGV